MSAFLGACSSAGESTGPEASKEPTPTPTTLVVPTPTPEPTATAVPTAIPEPSATPTATPTPIPATATPAIPNPVQLLDFDQRLSGSQLNGLEGIRVPANNSFGDGDGVANCTTDDQVRTEGGLLIITAVEEDAPCSDGTTRTHKSGMAYFDDLVLNPGQTLEIRAKISSDDFENMIDAWGGLWASSWAGSFPAGGVVNCGEFNPATEEVRVSTQYVDTSGNSPEVDETITFNDAEFHTIRCDYGLDGSMSFYFDGEHILTTESPDTSAEDPFKKPIKGFKVTLFVGGEGHPINGSAATKLSVDYIHVYDTLAASIPSAFAQSSFNLLNYGDKEFLARAGALGQFGFGRFNPIPRQRITVG